MFVPESPLPSRSSFRGRDTFPIGEGILMSAPDIIWGRISVPSLPGKVAFALQAAKDGRVDDLIRIFMPIDAVFLIIHG